MTVAREEIFGPVLTILGYDSVDEAVDIGNDTVYGLAAYVSGTDIDAARKVASRLRAGQVQHQQRLDRPERRPSAASSSRATAASGARTRLPSSWKRRRCWAMCRR